MTLSNTFCKFTSSINNDEYQQRNNHHKIYYMQVHEKLYTNVVKLDQEY